MLDKGVFAIENDLTLVGIDGCLKMLPKHKLDEANIAYHREHIYIND